MKALCGNLLCGPWVPGRHSLFLLFPLGAEGSSSDCCGQTLARVRWEFSRLATLCHLTRFATCDNRLGPPVEGFQLPGPRRHWDADRALSRPREQTVFPKQLLNNLSQLGKGGQHGAPPTLGAGGLRILGSLVCSSLRGERVTLSLNPAIPSPRTRDTSLIRLRSLWPVTFLLSSHTTLQVLAA